MFSRNGQTCFIAAACCTAPVFACRNCSAYVALLSWCWHCTAKYHQHVNHSIPHSHVVTPPLAASQCNTAAVVQVRYNAVRRQTAAKEGEKELQVLDYQNTNAELMPLVAAAYALIFMVTAPVFACSPFSLCWCSVPCQILLVAVRPVLKAAV